MKKRKNSNFKPIDLSHIQIRKPEYVEENDPDENYFEGFSLEELKKLGAISYPKTTKIIPNGEQAFFSATRNGEDW